MRTIMKLLAVLVVLGGLNGLWSAQNHANASYSQCVVDTYNEMQHYERNTSWWKRQFIYNVNISIGCLFW